MTISYRDGGGALKTIGRIRMRDGSNTLVEIASVKMRDASNTLVQVFGSSSAYADPTSVFGSAVSSSAVRIFTNSVTIHVLPEGTAFTVSWAGTAGWDATNPTGATTAFLSPPVPAADGSVATWTATITIGAGTPFDIDVPAEVTNFGT